MALVYSATVTHEDTIDVTDYTKAFVTAEIIDIIDVGGAATDIVYPTVGEGYTSRSLNTTYDTEAGTVVANPPTKRYRIGAAIAAVVAAINA